MIAKIKEYYRLFDHWMGYSPPFAMTFKGWKYFDKEFRERAPIRYYFDRTFKYKYIYPISRKYNVIKDWIRYRIYDRYHIMKTGELPGYAEVDHQILHVNFNALKNFVEVEQAWSSYLHNINSDFKPNFWQRLALREWRHPDLGIKYFEWASTLDDPALPPHEQSVSQAIAAREILVLYNWWMKDRPSRIEIPIYKSPNTVDEDSMWTDDSPEELIIRNKNYTDRDDQHEKWENEDTDMLCRLMKIRKSLWK